MNPLFKNVLSIIIIVALVYFGNKGVQTYLGKQAIGDLSFQVYDLERAIDIAHKQNKLVIADYSAIWCPSCRKLDTQVFASELVADKIQDNFIYARIEHDTEQGSKFAQKHDLVGFPRVLILDTNGSKLTEMPLTFDPGEYLVNLNSVTHAFSPN